MTIKTFSSVAAVIFTLVAVLHATRLLTGMSLIIGTWSAPMWASSLGLVITTYLAWQGFRLGKRWQ